MKWLIVEDSLESRRGHWFEYIEGFCRKLPLLGDDVTLLVSKKAEDFIINSLNANPILPDSAYLKMTDSSSALRRYLRIPLHAWKTFLVVSSFLKKSSIPDVIFVPTLILHHLLGWSLILKFNLIPNNTRVLLFFPSLPVRIQEHKICLDGSPSSRIMKAIFWGLRKKVAVGNLIIGVETLEMKKAAEEVFRIPFTYFPHPVEPFSDFNEKYSKIKNTSITMACYGPARSEKGSDVLVSAIEMYLLKYPNTENIFVIQWINNFLDPYGKNITIPLPLRNNKNVEFIDRYFKDREYIKKLQSTDILLLPYRSSSYSLRLSRVLIEAMVNGIPLVVTDGTTLESQSSEYGASVTCEDENAESLMKSIELIVENYIDITRKAKKMKILACSHFSVNHFREIILSK